MEDTSDLERRISDLERRLNRMENKKTLSPMSKLKSARIKEMIDCAGGAVLFSEVRAELGSSKQSFTNFIKLFLVDQNYVKLIDPTNKRKKYLAKRGFKFSNIEHTTIGYVYLLRSKNGLYKIGTSVDPEKRINQLMTGSSDRLLLIHTIKADSPFDAEKVFHKKFDHKRTRDEWFALDENDVKFMRSIETISNDTIRLLM